MAPDLLAPPGIGPVNASVIFASWSQPGRVRSEAALTALADTCPITASSGNATRHRLTRGGDRRFNRAIRTIAIVRMNCDARTRCYVLKRTQEGQSKKEIIRSLTRFITRQIFKTQSRPRT